MIARFIAGDFLLKLRQLQTDAQEVFDMKILKKLIPLLIGVTAAAILIQAGPFEVFAGTGGTQIFYSKFQPAVSAAAAEYPVVCARPITTSAFVTANVLYPNGDLWEVTDSGQWYNDYFDDPSYDTQSLIMRDVRLIYADCAVKDDDSLWALPPPSQNPPALTFGPAPEPAFIMDDVDAVYQTNNALHGYLVVKNDKSLWVWSGYSAYYRAPDGLFKDTKTEKPVKLLDDVAKLCENEYAIQENGHLWVLNNLSSSSDYEPVKILSGVSDLSLDVPVAITKDQKLYYLDYSAVYSASQETPVFIMDSNDVVQMKTVGDGYYLLKKDGSVWQYGHNGMGALEALIKVLDGVKGSYK